MKNIGKNPKLHEMDSEEERIGFAEKFKRMKFALKRVDYSNENAGRKKKKAKYALENL